MTGKGSILIAQERVRQVVEEGYTSAHDSEHGSQELAMAAWCYLADLLNSADEHEWPPDEWPWDPHYWKPTPDDPVRQLVKAGALVAAHIDWLLAFQAKETTG